MTNFRAWARKRMVVAAAMLVGGLLAAMAATLSIDGLIVTGCTATASSNAGTCSATKGVYTTGSLSTAHSAAATAQAITNTKVTTTSVVLCSVVAYSGTFGTNGNPTVACVPTANTITATIVNAADTNALSGTVGIAFWVLN
jgi:hypothetical protein